MSRSRRGTEPDAELARARPLLDGKAPQRLFKDRRFAEELRQELVQRIGNDEVIGAEDILFKNCKFSGPFDHNVLVNCRFERCGFWDIAKTVDLTALMFTECQFDDCAFGRVKLSEVSFTKCAFRNCTFSHETVFSEVRLEGVTGLETSVGLHKVHVEAPPQGHGEFDGQVRALPLLKLEEYASWERLRTFGRLPLFGISFSALVAIPSAAFLLAAYNEQVDRFHEWARAERQGALTTGTQLTEIADRLQQIPLPSLTFWLLVSTALLGVASTIHALFCPPRIKEFSLERWTDELRHPALHYLPLSWTHRWLRLVAALAYLVGGAGTLAIICVKLWNAAVFIIENTRLPWWWW